MYCIYCTYTYSARKNTSLLLFLVPLWFNISFILLIYPSPFLPLSNAIQSLSSQSRRHHFWPMFFLLTFLEPINRCHSLNIIVILAVYLLDLLLRKCAIAYKALICVLCCLPFQLFLILAVFF